MLLSHKDRVSLASSLQSPDCPLRELHLEWSWSSEDDDDDDEDDEDDDGDDDDDEDDDGDDGDLSVVFAALRGPHCKLETLRSVPVESSH